MSSSSSASITDVFIQRSFVTKHRRNLLGGLRVKECYIRNDINSCPLLECPLCQDNIIISSIKAPPHIVILDATSWATYFELFKHQEFMHPSSGNVQYLVLQSVLDELSSFPNSKTIVKNLRLATAGISTSLSSMLYVANCHSSDLVMMTTKHKEESSISKVISWLKFHLEAAFGTSNNNDAKVSLISSSSSLKDFITNECNNSTVLQDHRKLLEEAFFELQNNSSSESYDEYLSPEQIIRNSSSLVQGKLVVNQYVTSEAHVVCNYSTTKVFIPSKILRNRAIHGDLVVVSVLPKNEWKCPAATLKTLFHASSSENAGTRESDSVISGKVVSILSRPNNSRVVATVLDSNNSDEYVLAVPMDVRIPKIRIKVSPAVKSSIGTQRLVVNIDKWERDSKYPSGHYSKTLGLAGKLETEISSLLTLHQVVDSPFNESAIACLPPYVISDSVSAESSTAKRSCSQLFSSWKATNYNDRRRDLRNLNVFSVDPEGCQDIDDAMSITENEGSSTLTLGIHIADVSHFVTPSTSLDVEASRRCTTTYFVDRRFDMLPAILSADICSLHANRDRYAFSVMVNIDKATMKVIPSSIWFGKSIIKSVAALTYEQANDFMNGNFINSTNNSSTDIIYGAGKDLILSREKQVQVASDLKKLTKVSRVLQHERCKAGAVSLSQTEELLISSEDSTILKTKSKMEIHDTIAELMIFCNSAVATVLAKSTTTSALLRRHEAPDTSRFSRLLSLASEKNITMDVSTNAALNKSLENASEKCDTVTLMLLKSEATRAMCEAQYVIKGDVTNVGHYGLGLTYYTHFTSPIRRYADVIVHRQLQQYLESSKKQEGLRQSKKVVTELQRALPESITPSVAGLLSERDDTTSNTINTEQPRQEEEAHTLVNKDICEHINEQHRNAKNASRDCDSLFLSFYFQTHEEVSMAVITSLRENGFVVYVPKYDMKLPVYLMDKTGRVYADPTSAFKDKSMAVKSVLPDSSTAFAKYKGTRYLPTASLSLEEPDSKLVLSVADKSSSTTVVFRVCDKVKVYVTCDTAENAARVPKLQLHFVSKTAESDGGDTIGFGLKQAQDAVVQHSTTTTTVIPLMKKRTKSLYEKLRQQQEFPPIKYNTEKPSVTKNGTVGRRVYGKYSPPVINVGLRKARYLQNQVVDDSDYTLYSENSNTSTSKTTSAKNLSKFQLSKMAAEAQRRSQKLMASKRNDRVSRNHRKKN